MSHNILAIIPARGGSKGLPGKNIRPLLDHPLIAYSIKAALDAKLVTRVIVSTDDEEIARVSAAYGAEMPFVRPAALAGDMSTDLEVFEHAIAWLQENEGYRPDFIVQLRPTSPVREVGIIDHCIQKLIDSDADSLRIVTPSPCNPYKMWTIDSENGDVMEPLLLVDGIAEAYNQPRQKLPATYWQVGTLDVIRTACITDTKSMSGKKILSHVIPNELAIDIDDINSFDKAAKTITDLQTVGFY